MIAALRRLLDRALLALHDAQRDALYRREDRDAAHLRAVVRAVEREPTQPVRLEPSDRVVGVATNDLSRLASLDKRLENRRLKRTKAVN